MPSAAPAHSTKHLLLLEYPFRHLLFRLAQLDNGVSNGTALWLGAQCLSLYLAHGLKTKSPSASGSGKLTDHRRLRAIELGSGIGLSALVLSSLGWDVIATDLANVTQSVLANNVANNRSSLPHGSGDIQVRVLDWTVHPDDWVWDDPRSIGPRSTPHGSDSEGPKTHGDLLGPPFDMIITSDTIYSVELIEPLLRSLHALSMLATMSIPPSRPAPVYLCVERRDPELVDRALSEARTKWNFDVERIPHKKLAKSMNKGGLRWQLNEWEDVEIWKLSIRRTKEDKVA